jgi:rod shape determining protein RodA
MHGSDTVTMRLSDTQRLLMPKAAPLTDFGMLMRRLHVDGPLLVALLLISGFGLFVLYSAVGESNRLLLNQAVRLGVAFVAMFIVAQLPPDFLRRWTPWGYLAGLVLLVLVLTSGEIGQGARRWLDIGIRFQPSEAMKLGVPMMAAWYLHDRHIPPRIGHIGLIAVMIVVPTVLIARQPDLGTALLIAASGIIVIVLAGMSIRLMIGLGVAAVPGALVLWNFMQDYRLQHHPVQDRDRLGRPVRQGLDQRVAGPAGIPARARHRFHLRRARRRIRVVRRADTARALHLCHRPRPLHRGAGA